MIKPILGLVFACFIVQGCRQQLTNSVDRDIVECGISQKDLGSRKLFRSQNPISRDGFQVFDPQGELITDVELTSKNCLIVPESSRASSVVLSNGTASLLDKENLEFRSCGQDCSVYPVCGYFKSSPERSGPWVYAQINQPSSNLSGILEAEGGPQALDVSENSCIRIDSSTTGILRLSDSEGHFIEGNVQDLLASSPRQKSLLQFALREPLTKDEVFCKRNSNSHKMVQGACLLKDLRDYCDEFKSQIGKKLIKQIFGTTNCDRIWMSISNVEEVGITAKALESTKFFSNLPKMKRLNLSGNPDLGSFSELRGSNHIEELIVSHANFDLSELSLFPGVTSLTVGKLKSNWERAPVFPQIRKLELSRHEGHEARLLEKFPNVEEILIGGRSYIKGSLDFLTSFKFLKKIVIEDDVNGYEFPSLPSLEEIDSEDLRVFKGLYPGLKKVIIKKTTNIRALRSALNIEEIVIDRSNDENDYHELEGVVFERARRVEMPDLKSFVILNSFPNVEYLSVGLRDLDRPGYLERFDSQPFHRMTQLSYLKIIVGGYTSTYLSFQNLHLPKLATLYLQCRCDLKGANMPVLQKASLFVYEETLDLTSMAIPNIESLTLEMNWESSTIVFPLLSKLKEFILYGMSTNIDFLKDKVPNIEVLSFSTSASNEVKYIPPSVRTLSISGDGFDFNDLGDLPRLQRLNVRWSDDAVIASDASHRTIPLDFLRLEAQDFSDSNIPKLPNLVAKTFSGTLNGKVLGKIDFTEEQDLTQEEFLELESLSNGPTLLANVRSIHASIFIGVDPSLQDILKVFPGLSSLTGISIPLDYLVSNDGQIRSESFDLFDRLGAPIKDIEGDMSDEAWSKLDCMNHYQDKSTLGALCRHTFARWDYGYRPSFGFGWDYEWDSF